MNKKQERTAKLSPEDSKFLQALIEANEKVINITIYNALGEQYTYLAEDAVAQLYLLACEKIDVLRAHECPKAWLIVAAKLTAKSIIKKHITELSHVFTADPPELSADDNVFEEAVYSIWLQNKVPEKLIAMLTKREKEVYNKLYIENKTAKQAAAELGTTVNLINNVHKNLRGKIKNAINQKNFSKNLLMFLLFATLL